MDRDDYLAGGGDLFFEEHPDDWAAMVATELLDAELAGEAR